MAPAEIEKYVTGQIITLVGYTSTSKDPKVAINFATNDLGEGKEAVVYKIKFTGNRGVFFMSNSNFSAHHEEQEVLLQDGLDYKITSLQKS